ncbi:MAG: hypothetical protein P8Y44_08865, partial [Acidobacteriota bacterium]
MSAIAIELADTVIVVAGDHGVIAGPSPGYALADGNTVVVGEEARARCRLNPRHTLNNFWDQLGTETLPRPFPHQLTPADLAYRQLDELWRQTADERDGATATEGVVLAVPGSVPTWQLGLLLGVARSAEIPVGGMIDAAVASSSLHATGPRILHLEVLLHRMLWTEIDRDGGLVRRRVEEIEDQGLISLHDTWAKMIAAQFVRSTRFDPLHHAASEQALYDALPGWLEDLGEDGPSEISLAHAGRSYSVDMTRTQFAAAVRQQTETVVKFAGALIGSGETPAILLSSTAARIPGLQSRLQELQQSGVTALTLGAAAAGALAHRALIEDGGEELPFIVRLGERPATGEAPVEASRSPAASTSRLDRPPTHLAHEGLAYPIGVEPFWLGLALQPDQRGLNLVGNTAGISRSHCFIRRHGGRVVVE